MVKHAHNQFIALKGEFEVLWSKDINLSSESEINESEAKSRSFGFRMLNLYELLNFNFSEIPFDKETSRHLPLGRN